MQTLQRNVVVTNKLIECDEHFWPIQNVTNVNSRQVRFKRTDPRPGYSAKLIAICLIAGFFGLAALDSATEKGLPFWVAVIAGATLFFHIRNVSRRRSDYDRLNKVSLFELTIETSAGAKSLFYSYDHDTIRKIKEAIRRAIGDASAAINQTFHINTINDPVINNKCVIDSQTVVNQ